MKIFTKKNRVSSSLLTLAAFSMIMGGIFVPTNHVEACSIAQGTVLPTISSVVSAGGYTMVGQVLNTGTTVIGQTNQAYSDNVYANRPDYNRPTFSVLHRTNDSCSERFVDYASGMYYLAVVPDNFRGVIGSSSLGQTKVIFYKTLDEAFRSEALVASGQLPLASSEILADTNTTTTATPVPATNTTTTTNTTSSPNDTVTSSLFGGSTTTTPATSTTSSANYVAPTFATDYAYTAAGYTLRPDTKGSDDVARLQWALKKLDLYTLSIDGSYGPGTEKAVNDFQKAQNLFVDGLAGKNTQNAIVKALSGS